MFEDSDFDLVGHCCRFGNCQFGYLRLQEILVTSQEYCVNLHCSSLLVEGKFLLENLRFLVRRACRGLGRKLVLNNIPYALVGKLVSSLNGIIAKIGQ